MLIKPRFHMLQVQLTNKCNINCKHCYVSSHPRGEHGLPVDRLKRLADEVFSAIGRLRFTLTGGEPLVRMDDSLALLEHAARSHDLLLLTNGMLIKPAIARRLVELDAVVRISFDGGDRETHDFIRGEGSFERALRGARVLLDSGMHPDRLEMFMTVVPESAGQILPFVEFAERMGVSRLKIEPVAKTGRALEFWPRQATDRPDEDTRAYREFFASRHNGILNEAWRFEDIDDANFGVLTVYADGSVFPYTFQNGRDREVGYLGNILKQPLARILQPRRLSNAVVRKFLMQARGPTRSLRALRLYRGAQP